MEWEWEYSFLFFSNFIFGNVYLFRLVSFRQRLRIETDTNTDMTMDVDVDTVKKKNSLHICFISFDLISLHVELVFENIRHLYNVHTFEVEEMRVGESLCID